MTIEVVAIIGERLAQSVAVIEHGGHSVESESVEMELLQPILAVAEQEMDNVVLAIIEAEAVPCRMLVSVAGIEILVGVAGQVAQAFHLVLHGVRVDDIHHHGYSHLVGCVDERLQLLGCSEPA